MAKYKVTTADGAVYVVETADGPSQAQTPKAEERPLSGQDYIDAGLQGATFGFADEGVAAMRAAGDWAKGKGEFWKLYGENTEILRDRMMLANKNHGVQTTAATIAGAVPTMLIPGMAPARGATLGARVAGGVRAGALAGGVSGAGAAEGGFVDRAKGAAIGAGVGAGVGAAIPLVGGATRGIMQRLADGTADTWIGNALGKLPGVTAPGPARGNQKVLGAFQDDKMDLDAVETRLREMTADGKPAVLADVGKENTLGLADSVLIPRSSTRADAVDKLIERSEDAGTRITDDLATATGHRGDFEIVSEALKSKRSAEAAGNYAKAYAAAPDAILDPEILGYLHKIPKRFLDDAFEHVKDLAQVRGEPMPDKINLRFIDYLKRGIDKSVEKNLREGKIEATVLSELKQVKNAMLERLDTLVPEYGAARAAYRGDSEMLKAAEAGMKFASSTPEVIARDLATKFTTAAEREHFLLGAVSHIYKAVSKADDGVDVYRRVFGNNEKRQQLAALFPSADAFKNFANKMAVEKRMRVTKDAVRGNSKTAFRQNALEELGQEDVINTARQLATGNWMGPAAQFMASRARGNVGRNAEATVPLLFQDPTKALGLLRNAQTAVNKNAAQPLYTPAPAGVLGGLLTNRR